MRQKPQVLIVDHFSTFTHNLAQLFYIAGAEVSVVRTDMEIGEISKKRPSHLILSPGPGHPAEANLFFQAIELWQNKIPILGVCLGMQALAMHLGLKVEQAMRQMHGKTSFVHHSGQGLFANLRNEHTQVQVMRYHSLIPQWPTEMPFSLQEHLLNRVPIGNLRVTACSVHKGLPEIMAIESVTDGAPLVGVQFHPESFYPVQNETPFHLGTGKRLAENFLSMS